MKPGPARVLAALRRAGGSTCSGASLSSEQGISRAQIWKDVESLRAQRLHDRGDTGRRLPARRRPRPAAPRGDRRGSRPRAGWRAICAGSRPRIPPTAWRSTSRARAPRTAPPWWRRRRPPGAAGSAASFFSPPRKNFYGSSVLRPRLVTADAPPWILASAVAVAEAVEQTVGDSDAVEIKWPNDVLLGGLKTSGILMELSAEATRVVFLVLGIGVNLNVDRREFPEEFRATRDEPCQPLRAPDRSRRLRAAAVQCARAHARHLRGARLRGAAPALRGALPHARSSAHGAGARRDPAERRGGRRRRAMAPCCSGATTASSRASSRAT